MKTATVPVAEPFTKPKPAPVAPDRKIPDVPKRLTPVPVDPMKSAATRTIKPTFPPVCVKRPDEECSCGDTGCDGPPVIVRSAESASVCSSHDVFREKSLNVNAPPFVPVKPRSSDAYFPREVPKSFDDVSEKKTIRTGDEKFQVPPFSQQENFQSLLNQNQKDMRRIQNAFLETLRLTSQQKPLGVSGNQRVLKNAPLTRAPTALR